MGERKTCTGLTHDTETTEIVRRRYERIAPFYDLLDLSMELLAFRRWRPLAWAAVGTDAGRVLEVGVGTGKNIRYWPSGAHLTGIDLSPKMLAGAERRAAEQNAEPVLRPMDVECLDLPDASFDVAVATFVFCSVARPLAGLREVFRVLRPGGRLVLLEHQRSESRFITSILDLLDPLIVRSWGAHVNRPTQAAVDEAGFEVTSSRFLTPKGLVRLVEAHK